MILQLGNAGHPFGGSDVPGFYGEPVEDLWVMFYQLGMYYPFFRAHTHIDYPNREPWLQTQRVQTAIKDSLNRRYDLIHYIYTAYRQTTLTGIPLWRIMWNEFPEQSLFYAVASQFMLGDQILVAPKVTQPTAQLSQLNMQEVTFALPEGHYWYSYDTKIKNTVLGEWQTQIYKDLEQAVFVQGGSIIPLLQHKDCMSLTPCIQNEVTLEVYLDENDSATGSLYIDDGESFEYQTDSKFAEISMSLSGGTLRSSLTDGTRDVIGANQKVTKMSIYGFHSEPLAVLAGAMEAEYLYLADNEALEISLLDLPQDLDSVWIEIVWN